MVSEKPKGGWTFGRVLGLIAGVIGMAGFGFIGLCGGILAVVMNRPVGVIITWVACGLLLSILSALFVRSMNRRIDRRREDEA